MRGWAIDIRVTQSLEEGCCIGVVCSSEYPEPELIAKVVSKGKAKWPEATWVIRAKDALAAWACEQAGIEPIKADLNPAFKHTDAWNPERNVDNRRTARDFDLLFGCQQIVVFKNLASASLDPFIEWGNRPGVPATLHVIERGTKKKQARKGRKVA